MKHRKEKEIKVIFAGIALIFLTFLAVPMVQLLMKSFTTEGGGLTLQNFQSVFARKDFFEILRNSFGVAGLSAAVTTLLAFFLACTIHYTNIPDWIKTLIKGAAVLPDAAADDHIRFCSDLHIWKAGAAHPHPRASIVCDLRTSGTADRLRDLYTAGCISPDPQHDGVHRQEIYGRICSDGRQEKRNLFYHDPASADRNACRLLYPEFFLAFTDFGIPASVGGQYEVLASLLYDEMLGSIPDFNKGAVIAMVMLVPSVLSILLLHYLERYNVRYNKISAVENEKNRIRDVFCGIFCGILLVVMLLIFAVIFLVPFVQEWPYQLTFTTEHVREVFQDRVLAEVFKNSLLVTFLTACAGSLTAYGAALVTARSKLPQNMKNILESIALVTNTVPGMVIGIAFLLTFSGTSLQNTFLLMILCNVVHYFSTPYLMMKSSLEKMNASWETTAMLMDDNWMKTIFRVVTPNALPTLLEVFSYYFINAIVTVSAVIFIAGARTMVITTKIKEL